jgi:hypothetical protein
MARLVSVSPTAFRSIGRAFQVLRGADPIEILVDYL